MKISLNWIKDYIENFPNDLDISNLNDLLNTTVSEMESPVFLNAPAKSIIIVKILDIKKHPNADKLNIVTVSDGKNTLPQIVCGAPNIQVGQLVPVATLGTKLGHGEDIFEIKQAKIRGEQSNGMLCSEVELGIGTDHSGILILPTVAEKFLGKPLNDFLKIQEDVVLEIDNKALSNRPDLTGQYGFARETYVTLKERLGLGVSFKDLLNKTEYTKSPTKTKLEINDPEKCSRVLAIYFENMVPLASPDFIKTRLSFAGVKSINSIVDITNFVMLEIGQPMHAFDADKLKDKSINIRNAKKGEKLKLLDGKVLNFTEEDIVLCTQDEPIDLAGIMGGDDYSINPTTKNVIFAISNFNPVSIRKSGLRHNLRTESQTKFEKGPSPYNIDLAVSRILELVSTIHPEAKLIEINDLFVKKPEERKIHINQTNLKRVIGQDIEETKVISILQNLGCSVEKNKEGFDVTPPFWRKDLNTYEDIAEEVARFFGLENITLSPPVSPMTPLHIDKILVTDEILRDYLPGLGFIELMTRPFTTKEKLSAAGLEVEQAINVDNPVSMEATHLRYSFMPNVLETLSDNVKHTDKPFKIFEVGNVYKMTNGKIWNDKLDLPFEERILTLGYTANNKYNSPLNHPLLVVKENVKSILAKFDIIPDFEIINANEIHINFEQNTIGKIYLPKKNILKNYDLENHSVIYVEIETKYLDPNRAVKAKTPSIYPEVRRDLSIFFDKANSWEKIKGMIMKISPLVTRVEAWDIFEKDGKTTLTLSYYLQSFEKTLEDSEIKEVFNKVLSIFEANKVNLTTNV